MGGATAEAPTFSTMARLLKSAWLAYNDHVESLAAACEPQRVNCVCLTEANTAKVSFELSDNREQCGDRPRD
jgi:hypothetical protein